MPIYAHIHCSPCVLRGGGDRERGKEEGKETEHEGEKKKESLCHLSLCAVISVKCPCVLAMAHLKCPPWAHESPVHKSPSQGLQRLQQLLQHAFIVMSGKP